MAEPQRYIPNLEDIDKIMEQHGETSVAGYTPTLEDIDQIGKDNAPKNLWELVQDPSAITQSKEMMAKLPGDKLFKIARAGEKIPQALKTFGGDLGSLLKGIMHLPTTINKKYEAAKEVYPEVRDQLKYDPARFSRNVGAATADIGQEIMNIPHTAGKIGEHYGFVNPEEVPKEKNISKDLQDFVGGEQTRADKAIRKLVSHTPDIIGGAGLVRGAARRIPFTENVAQNVVRAEAGQMARHQHMYGDLFNRARQQGFNQVNFNPANIDIATLQGGSIPRHMQAIEEFVAAPTLENAQRAQSDMANIVREIEEKYGRTHVPREEQAYLHAAQRARDEIQNNMFRNPQTGHINQELANNYRNISASYAENVIPYSKHPELQEYKRRNLPAHKLLQSLLGGKFEVRKGGQHPGIKANAFMKKYGIPLSLVGALGYPAFMKADDILKDLLSPNSEQSPKGY